MATIKQEVPLSAVRPSGANPRKDFGDIGALADTIRATGGEPVNPIVVVRDGNVYRIVDGERRYRALREIYRSTPDRRVSAIVADSMDDANELVAMLATDDKQPLTDEERARGVQQMLLLGVDERRAAKAARVSERQVVAARRMARHVPEGRQLTLDQMEAAASMERPEDRDAVLAARDWRGEARRIGEKRAYEAWRAGVVVLMESAGVDVSDGAGEGAHGSYLGYLGERTDPSALCGEDFDMGGAFGGEVCAAVESGRGFLLYGDPDAREEAGDRAERERRDAHRAAVAEALRSMLGYAADRRTFGGDLRQEARAWFLAEHSKEIEWCGEACPGFADEPSERADAADMLVLGWIASRAQWTRSLERASGEADA